MESTTDVTAKGTMEMGGDIVPTSKDPSNDTTPVRPSESKAADASGGKKRKQDDCEATTLKCPVRPKKPRSAWMHFLNENIERFKLSTKGYMNAAGEEWKQMGDAEKKKYNDMSVKTRALYDKQMLEYKKRMEEYMKNGGTVEVAKKSKGEGTKVLDALASSSY